MSDLNSIPLYDHHCHALMRPGAPLDVRAFRRYFTESPDPRILDHVPETLFYQRAIRDLAALVGCDPTEEAYLAYRSERSFEEHVHFLIGACGIETMLVDTGLKANENLTVDEEQRLLPCEVREVLRLETLAERLILECETFGEMEERFRHTIRTARESGVVALKSIAAYRGGLCITSSHARPTPEPAFDIARHALAREGHLRLGDRSADRELVSFALLTAMEESSSQDLPIQFHTGFGDPDLDLLGSNPLHLRPLLENPAFRRVPVVLLHCWPFVRNAAYLTNVYGNVYMDLSLTIPFTAHGGEAAIREALELAPVSKVLLSTDAFSIPEIFYVGALGCRRSLGTALDRLMADDWLTAAQAEGTARMMLHENAEGLYGKIAHSS